MKTGAGGGKVGKGGKGGKGGQEGAGGGKGAFVGDRVRESLINSEIP